LKEEVVAAADRCSSTVAALGAANTLGWKGPDLVAESTDGAGFLDALRADEGLDPAGRRCLVVGAGGAARAVILALAGAGAAEIVVVNRTSARAEAAAALAPGVARVGEAEEADRADVVVNATPMGMTTDAELPVEPDRLGPGQLVVDLVYHPAVTPLVDAARARGAAAVNGLGMLIHQAAHQFRLWTGEDPPLGVMSAAATAELASR
jgi:shikimate dehydrogenase